MPMARKDFGISGFQTLLFLIEVVLPGLSAYGLSTVLLSDVAQCVDHFYNVLFPAAGVSSGLARLFLSGPFIRVLVHAVLTQIHTTMFVMSFATLCRAGRFRARATAILAGLRKRTVPATFFYAVILVGNYVVVIRPAFRLLDDGDDLEIPLMLLGGGTMYLAWMVCNVVCCRLFCPVQVLEDASDRGFGATRRRLAIVGAGMFWAVPAVSALLGGISIPVAVLTATAFPSLVLVVWTASIAVQWTLLVVTTQVAQPVVYQFLWDRIYSL